MPTAILAVAGYAISGAATISVGAATWTVSYAAIINAVALAGAAAFAAKSMAPSAPSSLKGLQDNIRSPDEPRRVIYGRQKVGGVLGFIHSTANNNYNLHLVVMVADHECDAIESVFLGDDEVPFNPTTGEVESGKYAGKARFIWRSGTDSQDAISELITEAPDKWTSAHRLRGIAYLYVRLIYDTKVYPSGIPVVSMIVRGKKVLDTRTGTTAWSTNPALCLRDYLVSQRHGLGVATGDIDTDTFSAAANICDESVSVVDTGGTEARYTCNGVLNTSARPEDNIGNLLTSDGGMLIYTGGKWTHHAAAWRAPAFTIDQTMLAGGVTIKTKLSARDRANGVKGTYLAPGNNWQAADFPAYAPAPFLTADAGVRAWRDMILPYTASPYTAQRLAKIELSRARQEITVELVCQLHALRVRTGDVVNLTLERYGWTAKAFEVAGWTFDQPANGGEQGRAPAPIIRLLLRETASAIYGWIPASEETGIDPAPNTNLLKSDLISAPSSLSATSSVYMQPDGATVASFTLTWIAPQDPFSSSQASRIEVESKPSSSSTWSHAATLSGDATSVTLTPFAVGVNFDFRIRSVSNLGVFSAWVSISSILAAGDVTAPDAPTSLAASAMVQGIRLTWVNPTAADLDRIEIFEHVASTPAPGGATSPSFNTAGDTFTRFNLPLGTTRFYWVRAVDRSGNKSAWAGPVNATASAVDTEWLAGQIQAAQLAVGLGGGNLLSNSAPTLGAETVDWYLGYNNTGCTIDRNAGFDEWRPPGGGSVFIRAWEQSPPFATQFELENLPNGNRIPIKPGQRYELSAYLSTHRCSGAVEVAWYDSGDGLLSFEVGATVNTMGSGVLSNWGRSTLFAIAPASAVSAKFIIRGFSFTSSDPYVFISNAYFGEALPNQTSFSFWSASGISTLIDGQTVRAATIGAGKLAANSVSADNIQVGAITAVKVSTNEIIATSANLGNAVVTTLKIGANQVTVPYATTSGFVSLPINTWTTITTLSVDSSGFQPMLVAYYARSAQGLGVTQLRLLIDGAVHLADTYISFATQVSLSAGNHTLVVQGHPQAVPGITMSVCISALETKR